VASVTGISSRSVGSFTGVLPWGDDHDRRVEERHAALHVSRFRFREDVSAQRACETVVRISGR